MESWLEIGNGIRLLPEPDQTLVLISTRLQLPLRPREGKVPGTAVAIGEALFEAREALPASQGWRWRLVPWPDGETVRSSFRLDEANLQELARRAGEDREWEARSRTLRRLLPLAGFAPGSWQQRWETELSFPAPTAVTVSCVLEGLVGAVGVIQLATYRLEGWWLPTWLRWLVIAGPFLVAEALFRFTLMLATDQPVGSLFGLTGHLFHRRPPPAPPAVDRKPQVLSHDPEQGHLELTSPVVRSDWAEGGILHYREQPYLLVNVLVGAGTARYTFTRVDGPASPTLRLLPRPEREEPLAKPSDGWLAGAVKNLLFSFAPGRKQEAWAALTGISPLLLTTASAAIEAFGGLVNLLRDGALSSYWPLDVFFLVEGLGRLVVCRLRGRAVGSLLGRPFLPLYARWLQDKTEAPRGQEPQEP